MEHFGAGGPVHRCLIEGDVVALEGLGLRGVGCGEVGLGVLPLAGRVQDGAPVRALLRW